jgi:MarR family transcriptional regulator for hemolysin
MLEADGLVERLADPNDRRNKHMKLTPAGYEALADMFSLTAQLRTQLLDGLADNEIVQADNFLKHLLGRIEGGLTLPDKS